jgi:hypothetical protein
MLRHFVDAQGRYLGGFGGGAAPDDAGAVEVPLAPDRAGDRWQGGAWARPLVDLRAEKLAALARRYDAALAAGMTYQGKVLQLRAADQQNIAAMGQEARWARAAGLPWPADFAWRMADNSFLPLPDAAAMIALGEAAKAEVYRLRQAKWAHADALNAATTAAEIAAYDIETGWDLETGRDLESGRDLDSGRAQP